MLDLAEGKRINIKDLVIKDVPRRVEQPFGPNPYDWNKIFNRFVVQKLPSLYERVMTDSAGGYVPLIYTSIVKSLSPNQEIGIDREQLWEKYKPNMERAMNGFNGSAFDLDLYLHMRNLFPEINLELKPHQLFFATAKEQFDKEARDYNFTDYTRLVPFLAELSAIAPAEAAKYDLDGASERALVSLENFKRQGKWDTFAGLAANLRLLRGIPATDLQVDERAWEGMSSDLKRYQNAEKDERFNFAILALNMKTLAAREAHITKSGLRLVMEDYKVDVPQITPNLPSVRKF